LLRRYSVKELSSFDRILLQNVHVITIRNQVEVLLIVCMILTSVRPLHTTYSSSVVVQALLYSIRCLARKAMRGFVKSCWIIFMHDMRCPRDLHPLGTR